MTIWLLAACSHPARSSSDLHWTPESGGTEPDCWTAGPPVLKIATVDCDVAAGTVTFDVQTTFWTGGGSVYEVGPVSGSPWSDEVELASYEFDSFCAYDKLRATLAVGVAVDEARPGESTPFTCADYDAGTLTFAVAVLDLYGDEADCRVWGADPQGLADGTLTGPTAPSFDPSACAVGTTSG